ncbi:MAG: hypothetical protein SGARI_004410, partial [Bacillariaceae sp.]
MELLCLGIDSTADSPSASFASPQARSGSASIRLPLLCLYTKKDVFLLKLSYQDTGVSEVEGTVVEVAEPYEDYLLEQSAAHIIRIQPAPQKSQGYATMCPPGAMALLSQDASTKAYTLCLHHGVLSSSSSSNSSGTYSLGATNTTSHQIEYEESADPAERFVDFCFCQSKQLSLLSSMTVALLQGAGRVAFVTPILFPGTLVDRSSVSNTVQFLESSIQAETPKSAYWNQLMTAKVFISDAFPISGNSNFITTAFKDKESSNSPAFEWSVQLQGPLIILASQEDENFNGTQAKSIVPFAGADDL